MTDIVEGPAALPGAAPSAVPPAALPGTVAPRPLVVAGWLLATSLTLCVLGYLALGVQGSWFTSAPALHWTPDAMAVSRGTASLGPEGLVLTAPDAGGTTIVTLTTSLRSSSYPVIAWQSSGVPDNVEAALLWRSDYAPGRVFNRRLTIDAGRIQPFSLESERNWKGTISGLALGLKGSYQKPILVQGATAKTMSAGEVLSDRVREWFTFETWNGASINTIIGGADVQDLPMPFALAVVVGLAALFYAALARWRPLWVGPSGGVIIGTMFVAAWFALDMRLQWNFLRQVESTAKQYAGKSWQERHLAAEDKMVFAFIEKVRDKLPPPPLRVFVVGDEHYFRDRGAYHLYPYNVFFDPWSSTLPPSSAVRSGDYLVVFEPAGTQYEPSQQRLHWGAGPLISAELVLADGGAALFKIL